MELFGIYIFAYVVGSLPTAHVIAKLVKGVDLRRSGSGNVGGSNLYQIAGAKWFGFLLVFDLLVKGAAPVWIGRHFLGLEQSPELLVVVPLLAVAGNNWSVFLGFQGGRGVAVALGTLLGLSPLVLAAFFPVGLVGWALTRNSGLWVLVSMLLLPLWAYLSPGPPALVWFTGALAGMMILKRILTNQMAFPQGVPVRSVLLNRLILDRDTRDRASWVHRTDSD
jgi:glycerol-3-phosphate acyltransferase PlsY